MDTNWGTIIDLFCFKKLIFSREDFFILDFLFPSKTLLEDMHNIFFFILNTYHYSLKWTSKHYTFHKLSLIIGICNLMTFYFDFNYVFSLAANSASWAIHRFIFSAVFSGGDARAPPEFGSSQKGTVFYQTKDSKNG